jgi:hypothetical protein
MFGVSFDLAVIVYDEIRDAVDVDDPMARFTVKHFLMGLFLLKMYSSESSSATTFGCTEKTFRKWSKVVVQHIADLKEAKVSLIRMML